MKAPTGLHSVYPKARLHRTAFASGGVSRPHTRRFLHAYFFALAAAGVACFFRSPRFFQRWRIFIRIRRCLLLLRAKATPLVQRPMQRWRGLITRIAAGSVGLLAIALFSPLGVRGILGDRLGWERDSLRAANLGGESGPNLQLPSLLERCGRFFGTCRRRSLRFLLHRGKNRTTSVDEAANLIQRKRGAIIAVDSLHWSRHAHGVQDGLFGGLHHRFVEGIEAFIQEDLHLVDHLARAPRNLIGSGKADDDLTRTMCGKRADAADAEGHALAQPTYLMRKQRRVRGNDRDDGALRMHPLRQIAKLLC